MKILFSDKEAILIRNFEMKHGINLGMIMNTSRSKIEISSKDAINCMQKYLSKLNRMLLKFHFDDMTRSEKISCVSMIMERVFGDINPNAFVGTEYDEIPDDVLNGINGNILTDEDSYEEAVQYIDKEYDGILSGVRFKHKMASSRSRK